MMMMMMITVDKAYKSQEESFELVGSQNEGITIRRNEDRNRKCNLLRALFDCRHRALCGGLRDTHSVSFAPFSLMILFSPAMRFLTSPAGAMSSRSVS